MNILQTIKKYILSIFVVGTFLGYTYYQRTVNVARQPAPITPPPISGAEVPTDARPVEVSTPPPVKVIKPKALGLYRDGIYTGTSADAYYGNIQVQVSIKNNKITDVQFLDYPQDRDRSVAINRQAMPILRSEAIQAQSANVDTVSGATDTSGAFRESTASALALARN